MGAETCEAGFQLWMFVLSYDRSGKGVKKVYWAVMGLRPTFSFFSGELLGKMGSGKH